MIYPGRREAAEDPRRDALPRRRRRPATAHPAGRVRRRRANAGRADPRDQYGVSRGANRNALAALLLVHDGPPGAIRRDAPTARTSASRRAPACGSPRAPAIPTPDARSRAPGAPRVARVCDDASGANVRGATALALHLRAELAQHDARFHPDRRTAVDLDLDLACATHVAGEVPTTPSPMAFPAIEVPPPRLVTGRPVLRHTSRSSRTPSMLRGNATASGRMR